MTRAINALSGVQWTDLDGITTTAAERTAITNSVSSTSSFVQNTEEMLRILERDRIITEVSYSDFETMGNISSIDWFGEGGTVNPNSPPIYPVCIGEEAARQILANKEVGAVLTLDERGGLTWVTKNYAGGIEVWPPGTNRWSLRQSGYPENSVIFGTGNLFTNGMSLSRLNQLTGLSLTANTRISRGQWLNAFNRIREINYREASKLPAADGGGLKTFNGKWYANGQELSYLDITFAVRVNQLFVINNTVTDYLSQLQRNNIKIKNSNAFAAIISSMAPAGSSGTTNINDIKNQFIAAAINAGLLSTIDGYFGSQAEAHAHLSRADVPVWTRVLFKHTDGSFFWYVKNGTTGTIQSFPFDSYQSDWSKVAEMFPQSISKILNLDANKMGAFRTGTLSQNDCTTIVTELKSYTTTVESSSQVAQTQLDQYNNKRTEVLDNISNVIKGNNTSLNSVAKNLGAL